MREFLSYIFESFRDATGWSDDNGYSYLNETANELLNFQFPRGLRMTLSSLATPHFATSYNLGTIGVVDGSISYLYSSVPLANVIAQSASIPLPTLLRSYRQLQGSQIPHSPTASAQSTLSTLPAAETPPTPPTLPTLPTLPKSPADSTDAPSSPTTTPPPTLSLPSSLLANNFATPAADQLAYLAQEARKLVDKPTLLFGRMYLPRSMVEVYTVKRVAPSVQLQLRGVSDSKLPNGGTVFGILQYDRGKYGMEGLASSDGGLLGFRGLYNFGSDDTGACTVAPNTAASTTPTASTASASAAASPTSPSTAAAGVDDRESQRVHGRFSAGGEIYYGTLNKSGGISVGGRFSTLPGQSGTPLTATMTLNPLFGNISATYAVVAREYCSLATKFEFNVYSYESEWAVGMELWSKRRLAGLVAMEDAEAETVSSVSGGSNSETKSKSDSKTSTSNSSDNTNTKKDNDSALPPALPAPPKYKARSFQAKLEWRLDEEDSSSGSGDCNTGLPSSSAGTQPKKTGDDAYQGVLKARLDQNLKIGLLWEGRIKSLLFSLGTAIDLNKLDQPFRTLGLEIQFSS